MSSSQQPPEAPAPAAAAATTAEEHLDLVREAMKAKPLTVAPSSPSVRVHKDECVYSFDTPFSPGGLYVNLSTWQSAGEDSLDLDARRSGARLYLHLKSRRVPVDAAGKGGDGGEGQEEEEEKASKPSKLAFGVEGGFQPEGPPTSVETTKSLVVLPQRVEIPLPCPDLPELVLQAAAAVDSATSATAAAAAEDSAAAWEEGERRVSRYAADLPQLEEGLGRFGRKVPPNPELWECEASGMKENLWLNLSTGYVGGGRANWDGTGGSGAALRHYEETGRRYPLAVKLGTITPDGGGDVYSYAADEDDMVLDPDLPKHLRHWGINAGEMRKTEKTVAEMQVDLNLSFEFDRITEAGGGGRGALRRLGGPGGLVGLHNLGNSCYVASVAQALYCLPPLRARYSGVGGARLLESAPADASSDLLAQTAKLVTAMVEGRTGKDPREEEEEEEEEAAEEEAEEGKDGEEKEKKESRKVVVVRRAAVRPAAFKRAAGAGHPEFSGARQQDAVEYMQHLLERLARAERAAGAGGAAPRGLAPFVLSEEEEGGGTGRGGGGGEGADSGAASSSFRPTADALRFAVEEKITCGLTGAARYGAADANVLSLDVPLSAATNAAEVEAAAARAAKRAKVEAAGAEAYIDAAGKGEGSGPGQGGEGAGASAAAEEEAVIDATEAAAEGKAASAATTATTASADDRKRGDGDKNSASPSSSSEPVLPRVPLSACLSKWAADETVEGYRSAAAGGAAVTATRRQRLATFPPFLAVQLKRYYVAADWTPRKLEVLVDVPETIDLAALRGQGPQPGEALQPEEEAAAAAAPAAAAATATATAASPPPPPPAPAEKPDPELVASLVAMGFSENGSKRAVLATASNTGAGVEGAMEWVLAHMEDPDFNDPLPPPPPTAAAAAAESDAAAGEKKKAKTPLEEADPDSLAMLQGMGFEPRQAAAALRACGGSLERAADWLFSRADGGLDAAVAEVEAQASSADAADGGAAAASGGAPSSSLLPPLDDPNQSVYRLAAVVSHMGRSTACGHYVAHARRGPGGKVWALFNDDRVAASARVPLDLGFLYLFARDDVAREAGIVVGGAEGEKEEGEGAEEAMKE